MDGLRFFHKLTFLTLGKLCQQRWLLAGLALLCFLLPAAAAPAAEAALSRGIGFSGITLAVSGPAGDPVPGELERLLANMSDVSQYCRVRAMEREAALESLESGEVHAVLVLPEGFVTGILTGRNPDVELLVRGDRPLEGLLTLWVGQSASDLLAAVQGSIYEVLALYDADPPAGLDRQEVVTRINLRYITWTMDRQAMFREETVAVTGQLPIGLHYGLSLLAFLVLSLAPFFMPVFAGPWIRPLIRFRAAGRGSGACYLAALWAVWLVLFPVLTAAGYAILGGSLWEAAGAGALCACFCAAFSALCCLLAVDTGGCGVVSFSAALAFLALGGGILPPVLMPGILRDRMGWSPVSWLRQTLSGDGSAIPALLAAALGMTLLGAVLYRRRMEGEGESL